MGSKPRTSVLPSAARRPSVKPCSRRRPTRGKGGASVSDKLEALKNLIPSQQDDAAEIKPDKLFKDTAEYIVLLKTQVLVLQKLVEYYGSSSSSHHEKENDPDAAAV